MPITRLRNSYGTNAAGQQVPVTTDTVLLMDGAITIGQLPIPVADQYILTNAAITENAAGDISINVAAGQNAVIGIAASEYIKQINAFLSTTSVPPINNSGLLADATGDTPVLKGTKITSFQLAYSIQGGPLTSFTFRADLNVQANAAANVISNVVAVGQNGLSLANTASATTCTITTIPVAVPAFDVAVSSQLYIRLNPVTPGGCTFRLYGMAINFSFNLN
jgi:hypothetical protein